MTTDLIDRLRRHPPAPDADPTPPEHLLERIVAEPRGTVPSPRRRRSRTRRLGLLAGALAAAATGAVGIPALDSGGSGLELVARAYAQTAAPDGQVLHVVTRSKLESPHRPATDHYRREQWTRGPEAHAVTTSQEGTDAPQTIDTLVGADGVLRFRVSGDREGMRLSAEDERHRAYVESQREDFVETFRSSYRKGELDSGPTTTFAGRVAKRYVVRSDLEGIGGRDGTALVTDFYVDARTAAPLGRVETAHGYTLDQVGGETRRGPLVPEYRLTEVVETLEHLPPDAATLDRLRSHDEGTRGAAKPRG